MKNVCYAFLLLAALVAIIIYARRVCCPNNQAVSNTPSKTDTVNLDKTYRVSNAKFKGHDYLLFESGEKGEKGYAIFLEHKADCKVCCEQFD